MAKVKIEDSELKKLKDDSIRLQETIKLVKSLEDMCQSSYHIDPGFEAMLRLIREWMTKWNG